MSKKELDTLFSSWNSIPEICRKQVEVQREHYFSLIDRMEEYEWRNLFTTGVEIKEKEGDVQVFIAQLVSPIQIRLFIPGEKDGQVTVQTRTFTSILESKLQSIGHYLGPLGRKIKTSDDEEEIGSPFRFLVDKEKRIVRISCA